MVVGHPSHRAVGGKSRLRAGRPWPSGGIPPPAGTLPAVTSLIDRRPAGDSTSISARGMLALLAGKSAAVATRLMGRGGGTSITGMVARRVDPRILDKLVRVPGVPVVAITGSNGKTTVKEMLACILREAAGSADAVLATKGNLNNDIGMPLTLLQLNASHRYAVIEMGMNHSGEIDYLTRIAAPDVALINNASGAHLEGLGSTEAVARAKGEIFTGLQHHGTAIINSDDIYAELWRALAGAHPLLEFGLDPQADVRGTWHPRGDGLRLDVTAPQGIFTADLQVPGVHNARNALAATAAAIALNIPLETIAIGLQKFRGVPGRLQRKSALHGAILIDDTYNANPASVRAAISVLAQANGKRILVLGDMGELGGDARKFHKDIGADARRAGIEKLYVLGSLSETAVSAFGSGARHFNRIEDLQSALEKELDANTTVLVKGSRFMKMERVVQFCAKAGG
jgi:UDP-N-acetylmuramoyl-tripeptide--D-alanyl-D-alanine ligase